MEGLDLSRVQQNIITEGAVRNILTDAGTIGTHQEEGLDASRVEGIGNYSRKKLMAWLYKPYIEE